MDPWEVLETPKSAGVDAAKRAWRELVALYHPDHHADMPAGVQKRAASGLRRVNEAWAAIREAEAKAEPKPAPAPPKANFVEGNGLRIPVNDSGDWVFYVDGAPFDAKRRIKQATKAANFSMKAVSDNTIVLAKGMSARGGVVIELIDNDGETTATVTDGSPALVNAVFEALRASI